MPRRSFPVHLRPEARTAAFMLAAVQMRGDDSPHKKGLQFWLSDLIDTAVCGSFEETFGLTIAEFLSQVGAHVWHPTNKYRPRAEGHMPRDSQLSAAADILFDIHFAALGGQQCANPAGGSQRRRGRKKLDTLHGQRKV